jgi:hypothetical protein
VANLEQRALDNFLSTRLSTRMPSHVFTGNAERTPLALIFKYSVCVNAPLDFIKKQNLMFDYTG